MVYDAGEVFGGGEISGGSERDIPTSSCLSAVDRAHEPVYRFPSERAILPFCPDVEKG